MIPVCEPLLDGNEREYVNKCLDTGWISSGGEFVDRFEREFAAYCGCEFLGVCLMKSKIRTYKMFDVQ